MPAAEDSTGGPEGTSSFDSTRFYMRNADTRCVFCWNITERNTAEMLYVSQEWDYYYCYRCRGWFKRHYGNKKVVLPVRDKRDIRHLTFAYVSNMQRIETNAQFARSLHSVWRVFGRRPHARGEKDETRPP